MGTQAIAGFFAHIPTDWIILFSVAVFAAFDAFRSGTSRVVSLAIALPLTFILALSIPGTRVLGALAVQFSSPIAQDALFLILLALVFILLHRITRRFAEGSNRPAQALLSGLALAVVLVVVWVQIPALESIWHFGQQAQTIFGAAYRFWWLIVAYIALASVRG